MQKTGYSYNADNQLCLPDTECNKANVAKALL